MMLGATLDPLPFDDSLSLTPKRAPVSRPEPEGRGGGASLGRDGLGDGALDEGPADFLPAGNGGLDMIGSEAVAWSVSTSMETGSCFSDDDGRGGCCDWGCSCCDGCGGAC